MRALVVALVMLGAATVAAESLTAVPAPRRIENPRVVRPRGRVPGMRPVAAAEARGVAVVSHETAESEEWALVRLAGGKRATPVVRRRGLVYPDCLDLSPDAARAAVGVWEEGSRAVVIVELPAGTVRRLVSPPPDAAGEIWVACEVVFSPDGRRLAVGVQRAHGSRVVPPWVQIHDVTSGARIALVDHADGLKPLSWDARGLLLEDEASEKFFRWTP